MPPYTPIPCNFHDRLLHFATLRQAVRIIYLPEGNPEEAIAEGIIEDVYTQASAEYLRLHNGLTIRLDQLVQVGDYWMNDTASC
jgi:Rho-binding antiterminator